MSIKGKALLFGLNYDHCKSGKLNGCVNDVNIMGKYISSLLNIPVNVYTDDVDRKNTSYDGIIQKLYDLAIESYKENLEFVWIHYSGHGSHQKDTSGDELDGEDEALVPSDYETKGILIDDVINKVFNSFNPKTRILFICDACHSGSILDLTFTWDSNKQSIIDNKNCAIKAPTMLISGCRDNQTSADTYNILDNNKYIGALTGYILKILRINPRLIYDAFALTDAVRNELIQNRYSQYPCLSTNYDISKNAPMIPTIEQSVIQQYQQPYKPPQQPVILHYQPYKPPQQQSYKPPQQPVILQYQQYKPPQQQPVMQQYQPPQQQPVMQQYQPPQQRSYNPPQNSYQPEMQHYQQNSNPYLHNTIYTPPTNYQNQSYNGQKTIYVRPSYYDSENAPSYVYYEYM